MKIPYLPISLAFVASLVPAQAGTTTVLESFEDNLDNVAGINDRVTLSTHTAAGADDENVSEGKKSLKVVFSDTAGWGQDLNITLDAAASKKIRDAFAGKELARWLVRYDLIFPVTGTGNPIQWMVNSGALGGFERGQLEGNGGTLRTMTFPLDLVAEEGLDLSGEDDIVMRYTCNFGANDGWGTTEIYLDNFRLVDTYADGAKPVVTVLNSFETEADLAKIVKFDNWNVEERYELKLHPKTGADDITVTEGSKSLEIALKRDGGWSPDYEINLSGTPVVEALKLPKEQRGRYTLRWDVIFEDSAANGNWNGNWENYIIWTQNGAGNYALGRRENGQHMRTYNLVLDEVTFPEPDTENPDDQASWIGIINQGAWTAQGMTMHIDNIRLIDTGVTGAAPAAPLALKSFALDPATSNVNLRWSSAKDVKYTVEESADLKAWTPAAAGLPGQADATTHSLKQATLGGQKFFRVRVAQ